jgi:hypothetical protein
VCSQCKGNYLLNGFNCLPPELIPPHCELYDPVKGHCSVCEQGYEMQHRYCQREDQIEPLGGSSGRNSALQMPSDVLDGTVVTASVTLGKDNLLPLNYGVTIDSFGSSKAVSAGPCWLRAPTGLCSVCKEGYNLYQGTCNQLPPICLAYSQDKRTCLKCDPVLTLQNGTCLDINCAVGIFSRCSVCKQASWQPDNRGVCLNQGCAQLVAGVC